MRRRRLVITLPQETFRTLEDVAREEERATDQQASLLLRRAITSLTNQSVQSDGRPK